MKKKFVVNYYSKYAGMFFKYYTFADNGRHAEDLFDKDIVANNKGRHTIQSIDEYHEPVFLN